MPGELSLVDSESGTDKLTVEITPQQVTGNFDKYRVKIWNGSRVGIEETEPLHIK